MPTSFWMKFKQGFLLISLLLSCHGWGVAQNPGVNDGENSFSYLWQHVRVRLEIDPVSMAVFIPDAEDSILVVERQLRSLGIQEQVLSIKETPYPGLLILHLKENNAAEVVVSFDSLVSGWASPCLRYRGRLHIPRPEILITLDPDDPRAYDRVLAHPDISLIREFPSISPLLLVSQRMKPRHIEQTIEQMLAIEGVVAASPNFIMHLRTMGVPDDTFFGSQWHLQNTGQQGNLGVDIDAADAWGIETGSPSIRISIIDEGVDVFHEDLISHIVAGHDSTSQASPSGVAGNCLADDAHGTSCAGLAAAEGNNGMGVSGVAWSAQIQPIRVGFGDHWTENSWIIDALTWATDNGADILSNSWGGGAPSTAEQNTVQYGLDVGRDGLGCILLFASGNEDSAIIFPAAYPETIAVGATSPCDERKTPSSCDGVRSWGSNFGTQQTVVAPGVLMATTDNTGPGGFVNGEYLGGFGGTSAATPVVAGAMALLLSQDSTLTAAQAQTFLEISSEDQVGPPGQDTPGFDINFGHGRINVANLLAVLGGPQAPLNLTCSDQGVGVQLTWTAGEPYDQIIINRDGSLLATLAGNVTGFLDVTASTGQHTWEIFGIVGSLQSLSQSCTVFLLGNAKDLIYAPETGVIDSGAGLAEALLLSGRDVAVTSNLSSFSDLDVFDRIWIQLGMFPNNFTLTLQEGDLLDSYLSNGIGGDALYMEGGDTWFFDPSTAVHTRFGITALSDGSGIDNLGLVLGSEVPGCDLSGLVLDYTAGENSWVDRLSANPGSSVVQSNTTPPYDVAVYRNAFTFKTLGASYELGGITDGTSTKLQLVEAIIQCFEDILNPPSDLFCDVIGTTAEISWTNSGGWDSVEVTLDGAAAVILPGTATSIIFTGLEVGGHTVQVVSVAGVEVSDVIACSFGVTPVSPSELLCQQQGFDVQITWTNGQLYEAVEIFRDGILLDTLAGTLSSYVDTAPGVGAHQYFVQGSVGGFDSLPAICGLVFGPIPVTSLSCTLNGSEVDLSWVNAEAYDSISVLRNGILIASLNGDAISFTDTPGAGTHQWSVGATIGGITSVDTVCSLLVPPATPSSFSCLATGAEVLLQWTNAPGYDQIIVTRDGAQIASLSGIITSLIDIPGPGTFLYEVAGANGGIVSDTASCIETVSPQPVTSLQCLQSGGSVVISWIEEAGIDAVEVRRDGVLIETVTPGLGFIVDTSAAAGIRNYSLRTVAGSLTSTDSTCDVIVPPGNVTALICQSPAPETTFLSWSSPPGATTIRIERAGAVIAELPASTASFVEDPVPSGIQIYFFIPAVAGVDGTVSSCAVDVQAQVPPPVAGFTTSTTAGDVPLTVDFVDTSTGVFTTWLWQFDDGSTSLQQSPSHTFTGPGSFNVVLTVAGPGGVDSATTLIVVTAPAVPFVRGDGNGDGVLDISDPVQTLEYIFGSGQADCLAAIDFDDGGELDIADAIGQLSFIFGTGGAPQAPFPGCGTDPTPDNLGCALATNCP